MLRLHVITNPIDATIRLQITLIEEYFFDFLFDARSAFKGWFWSTLAIIRDQSWLNMVAIESKT